ncbi:MAG: hypothetical protein ACREBG_00865 [Pyrinomonadaceae bacterium]
MVKTLLVVGCLLCSLSISIRAQRERDKWQRVYTGEESVIDVNVSGPTFDAGHVLRVKFRTTLSKPESLKEKPGTKYKSRLETIEFKLTDKRYRIHDISFLDSAGKTAQSYEANASEDWKVLKVGGMMQRLFDAARQLTPFGDWKVVDYRFGDGTPSDAKEFRRLLGTRVRLNSERAEVGMKRCSSPAYQSKSVTDKEFFRELGISMESIGIQENYADTIVVKCEANGWAPPQSLLVKLPAGRILMLWEGVFLVLKKEGY